tara:strand:+ start:219 stop:653 length:435 start_codon:yes stop_codon:yes gene_type:complete
MPIVHKRVDLPLPLVKKASKKVLQGLREVLEECGIARSLDAPVIQRDVLAAAIARAERLAEELKDLGFTATPSGTPRRVAFGVQSWKRLERSAKKLDVSQASLLRASMWLLAKEGLPELDGGEWDQLLEGEGERRRLGGQSETS